MKKTTKILLLALAVIIVAVSVLLISQKSLTNSRAIADQKSANSSSENPSETQVEKENGDNNTETKDSKTSDNGNDLSNSKTDNSLPSGKEWRSQTKSENVIDISGLLISKDEANQDKKTISLPYKIPGSNLTLLNYTSYSGEYLEDGKDENVDNAAVIVIENNSSQGMDYCEITLTVNGQRLSFEGTGVAANSQIAIMAKDKASFVSGAIEQCSAVVSEPLNFETSSDKIELISADDNGITIKNISNSQIPVVRIFYKYYDPESNGYIGGITYNYPVRDLKSGEETTVFPGHFAGTDSKVIMIRTYDSYD